MAQKRSVKKNYPDLHGIVLLNKPKGISSNLALQKVRHLFKAKKAGHTGNLDPMATGLLPCCFGDATKVAHLLINSDKTYVARCVLGSQTDTGDATGEVVETSTISQLTDEQVLSACQALTGEIEQIPPMYSALHHNGRRLYELAREGKTVERPARKATIHQFKLLENSSTHIDFEIKVSKGTYIRTLLEDFAKACGTVAHMSALHRTQTGIFSGDDMLTLEQFAGSEMLNHHLIPMDKALVEYPKASLSAAQSQDLIHGKTTSYSGEKGIRRLYDHDGHFLGMGELNQSGVLRVKKLFLKSYQGQLI